MRTKSTLAALLLATVIVGCGGGSNSPANGTQEGGPEATPLRVGSTLAKPLFGTAIVGREYKDSVVIVPNDSRSQITALTIANPTPGGGVPSIDINGSVRWTPNDLDLQGTTAMTVTATVTDGAPVQYVIAVRVNRELIVLDVALGPDEASYSDPAGRYLVRAKRANAALPIAGRLKVFEYYDKEQLIQWRAGTEGANDSVLLEVLNAPNVAARQADETLSLQSATEDFVKHPLSQILLTQTQFEEVELKKDGSVLGFAKWHSFDGNDELSAGTDVFTSRAPAAYNLTIDGDFAVNKSASWQVFDFLSSCPDNIEACREKASTKSPIVLIHGFSGSDNISRSNITGGGADTWGGLAKELIAKGHPVFEMKWHTYMRFEEAAGALTKFTQAVSKYTLKKPIVIAHSFGGIVTHLALQSQGIEYRNSAWRNVEYKNQVAKVITLNSPLSGINHPAGGSDRSEFNPDKGWPDFQMTRGRDHTDRMIGGCYAITCLQAGALFSANSNNGLWLKAHAALITGEAAVRVNFNTGRAPETVMTESGNLIRQGESIHRLQAGLPGMRTPILRFAGFQTLGVTDANTLLGDGLISLIGMAVLPVDFATNPYNVNSNFGYRFIGRTNYNLYSKDNLGKTTGLAQKKFSELVAGDCIYYNSNPNEYAICAMSAHTGTGGPADSNTSGKRVYGKPDFSIANLGNEDKAVNGVLIPHPLKTLMDDVNWVAAPPEDAPFIEDLLAHAPESIFTWRAYREVNGEKDYSYLLPAFATVTNKSTGQVVMQTLVFGNATTNLYKFNLGRELTRSLRAIPNLDDHVFKLQIGGSIFSLIDYASYYHEFTNLPGIQLITPEVDLTKRSVVSFSGKVIDGQTSNTPVSDATIYVAKGADRTADYLRSIPVAGTQVTKRTLSDVSGNFSFAELEPGDYSVLVIKPGYTDALQGRVTISANTVVSFNLLKVLTLGEASITLRWANSSAGVDVVRDLDSHLLRLNSDGSVNYHIYYVQRTVPGLVDSLDRDDTDYEGPETITLKPELGKNYVYYVHQFSSEGTIVQSLPQVFARIGNTTESFTPPSIQGSRRYWHVFDIVDGVVKRCQVDCLQDIPPAGLTTLADSIWVPQAFQGFLGNLPAKN